MKTFRYGGKAYECKYYDYDELKKIFADKIVVLESPVKHAGKIMGGKLIGICTTETKDATRSRYVGRTDVVFVDFTFMPLTDFGPQILSMR